MDARFAGKSGQKNPRGLRSVPALDLTFKAEAEPFGEALLPHHGRVPAAVIHAR